MVELNPIGVIHTPYQKNGEIPFQAHESEETGEVEVFGEYEEGLKDIEGFSHIIILFELHKAKRKSLKENRSLESLGLLVKPYLDNTSRGLFATRSPNRPNSIGLTIVELLKREENILQVRGVDMLDGTPLLDLKPYVPEFDRPDDVEVGWLHRKL